MENKLFGTLVHLGFWFQYCSSIVCGFFLNVVTAFPVFECYRVVCIPQLIFSRVCLCVCVCLRETRQAREFQNTSEGIRGQQDLL